MKLYLRVFPSYPFEEAVTAFQATKAGKSEDGKGVIKVIISGPGVQDWLRLRVDESAVPV